MVDTARILVVDDDEKMRQLLAKVLQRDGHEVATAANGVEALQVLRGQSLDIVLTDIRMPAMDGMELLAQILELAPETTVIIMTAFGTVDSAVEAMRSGAFDYISKPFKMDEVQIVISRVVEDKRLRRQLASMSQALVTRYGFDNLIGKSRQMLEIYDLIERAAPSSATVLIRGRSGTGKELVARAMHYNSQRKEQPFVAVNCSAIPEDLLESELFGHIKGSFTGATADKRGLFVEAEGGTIFLDEVGDMGRDLQSKLLRVLQDKLVRPVGGAREEPVDVRVVAATNQDLEDRMRTGQFREDLFFRLNVIPIVIPDLRERSEDIPLLVKRFLEKYRDGDGEMKSISREAMAALVRYAWPGNVRELENVIERATVLCMHDEIGPHDLPASLLETEGGVVARLAQQNASLADLERDYIRLVLQRAHGNQTVAAQILGIDRRTLYRKLQSYKGEEANA